MAQDAKIGKGYVFSYSGTVIGEILECKPGKRTQAAIEVQTNDAADLYGYKILGWCSVSDWEIKTVWYQSQYATLKGFQDAGAFAACIFTRPDGTNTTPFSGAIVEIGDDVPLKEYMTTTFKVAVSGKQS